MGGAQTKAAPTLPREIYVPKIFVGIRGLSIRTNYKGMLLLFHEQASRREKSVVIQFLPREIERANVVRARRDGNVVERRWKARRKTTTTAFISGVAQDRCILLLELSLRATIR